MAMNWEEAISISSIYLRRTALFRYAKRNAKQGGRNVEGKGISNRDRRPRVEAGIRVSSRKVSL
jgi:hypothetical protein